MTERPIACAEVQKYGDVVRRVGSDVELVKLMALETPASARCTRAEQLRSLMAMISGDGFDVFDTLDEELKRKRVPLDSMGASPGSKGAGLDRSCPLQAPGRRSFARAS